ncbi:hypothetical protein Nos7524_2854 [Nostoc sp. PCC 7524]|uniref:helix-turn-helix domain-containing protein n=1 Tax=Nostoc sp. (strain ATCC 29411 / PCC 7524) TaxID=28072 RepID=UPI00029F1694|nr:helix-turn-helix domain-containing protein [Nostoc sp. PCC 7524]AFY48672.1 hypothetical protein Nos7524_2854 [Nostoc sp. PCC 7524]
MSTEPVYLLTLPGNQTVAFSQEELRSLLGQIEAQLHRSQVYRRIVARLQTLLSSSGEQVKVLCQAIGREAIGIAFQQFAQQQTFADIEQDTSTVAPESHGSTSAAFISKQTEINTNQDNTVSTSKEVTTAKDTEKNPVAKFNHWLQSNKKPAKPELAKQIPEQQRLDIMRQIGVQLRKARESQNLSLSQLHIYTHIPLHQMEAVENANFETLPEDVCVRGFIRIMGNALGLNGMILAASLPTSSTVKSILPSWCQPKNNAPSLKLELRPLHLYLGYTALVAGAVGGLSYVSQPATNDSLLNSEIVPPSSSTSRSPHHNHDTIAKPGIKSSTTGISVGHDISPPEAFYQ